MEKFVEVCCIIIILLLCLLVLRTEKFAIGFTRALEARDFNFKVDDRGYSQADKYLANSLFSKN